MSAAAKLVGHDELGRFIADILVKHGASAHDAAIVAQGLVWANCAAVTAMGCRGCDAM